MRKKWEKVIEKWEIMGNSGKNCDSGISSEQRDLRARKFHFAQNIFVLNWALVGATERCRFAEIKSRKQKVEIRNEK